MAKIYKSTEDLIGNTPLIQVSNIKKELGFQAEILAKLEYLNPAGSAKDRVAKYILNDAEEKGILTKDSVISDILLYR